MSTPRYVAVKVGDEYQFRRIDTEHRVKVGSAFAGGLLLSYIGLRRGSLPGLGLLAAGAGLCYFGVTGKNPISELRSRAGKALCTPEGTASHLHDDEFASHQSAEDSVDEAAMESFPASDPPARSVVASA